MRETRRSALFSAAPHGVAAALIDRLLARRRGRRDADALRRHLGGFPLLERRRLRGGLQARAWRARAHRAIHLRGARTSAASRRRRTWRIPGCFATATLLASVPLLASGLTETPAVRHRHHRQHRIGPQARRGHASSAAAWRSVLLRRARSPACTRDRRLRASRDRRRGGNQFRAPFGSVRARHSRHGAGGAASKPIGRAPRRSAALAGYYAGCPFVRVSGTAPRVKDVAASNYAQLERRDQWHVHRRHVGARQFEQGRRRRRHAMDEPAARASMNVWGSTGARRPVDLRRHATCSTTIPDRQSHLAQVFAQYPIEVAHGDGVWLHTRDGRKILDFYGGHAVAGLGYGHPRWLAALDRQARQMAFQTNAVPVADPRAGRRAPGQIRGPRPRYGVLDQQRRRGQ